MGHDWSRGEHVLMPKSRKVLNFVFAGQSFLQIQSIETHLFKPKVESAVTRKQVKNGQINVRNPVLWREKKTATGFEEVQTLPLVN